jgi:hypothetical protein
MAKPKYVPYQPSYNIEQFCICEGMSRPFYNALRDLGLGPKEMRYGAWVRISHTERLRWQERMANLTPEQLALVQETRDRLNARARKAAAASVASPKHISVNAATRRKAIAALTAGVKWATITATSLLTSSPAN